MISQSTAEIKLLPVSENGRPPFRNSISGFDVISIFSRWLPADILDLTWVMLSHTRSAIAGVSLILKFGVDPIYVLEIRFIVLEIL